MQNVIKHKWFYDQLPEEIWVYLTSSELMAQWLMPNDFKLELGHDFKFTTNPIPSLNLDGIFRCTLLEVVPYSKLAYSWKGGVNMDDNSLDTVVVWTLKPKSTGTEIGLVHSGFSKENNEILAGMTQGWLANIEKMLSFMSNNQNGKKS